MATSLEESIKESFKNETIILGEDGLPSDVKIFIPTGSTLLDYAITNRDGGGIPVGKITEIAGLEASGKTLLAMQICANAQKMGGLAVYMDPERALNSDFAKRVGLNVKNNFIYMCPRTVEDVFKAMFTIFHKLDEAEKENKLEYPFCVIVWDSVAASPTKEDLNAENPDPTANIGLKARILSKNVALMVEQSGRKNVAQVFLNQLRMDIKKAAVPFLDPYITTGGNAIPYYASVRIRLFKKGKIKVKDEIIGILTKAKIEKTRFGPPYRECEFGIYFAKGVDDTESLIDFLTKKKRIKTKLGGAKGKLYSINGENFYTKLEFRKKISKEEKFKQEIMLMISELMKKDLANSNEEELLIEDD